MLNLMIVDDEELIREEIKSKVTRLAHPLIGGIMLAADGQEAKQLLHDFKPQIVISDIRMPGLDGLSLIRDSFQTSPDVKFIVLSGYGDYEYVREAFKYGIVDYLLKPVRLSELENQLNLAVQLCLDSSSKEDIKATTNLSISEANPINSQSHISSKSLIGIVKKYIEERPYGEVTLAEVSNLASMNYTYFSTWFKEETGFTFSAYIMRLKMEQAKKLLENPTIRVSEVAQKIGYDNIYHFSRAFKNYTGLSPKDYRKCTNII
ncbi:response regulator transcription factor [Paenibacillus glycanilyticus]|uniref:DNA-binding response regulator n=1 Tax=Paenibacillus glycanilyticus TaxID=126569 RepID=A0ABQ6GED9_9BACL|nr:response regulator [Paenibacillus glycanilyticus]GLX68455.1 DNA-binding response regulator [Paenibacillus glycanilyticus]